MVVLYLSAILYALGTAVVLGSLYKRNRHLQRVAMWFMLGGFAAHTIWIGIICTRTNHPPLTNLPEAAAFIGWTLFLVDIGLFLRYRVHAASLFIYPLVLMLISISLFVHEPFLALPAARLSSLFLAHLLLSALGVAALLIGVAFVALYQIQQRELKRKHHGPLFDLIPSLHVCEVVSYRALSIGFVIYTLGLGSGFLWAWRRANGVMAAGSKEIGAITAWLLFAILLHSYINGSFRARRAFLISAAGFVALIIAVFGIRHV